MQRRRVFYLVLIFSLVVLFILNLFVAPHVQLGLFFQYFQDFMADFWKTIYYVSDKNPYYFGFIDPAPQDHAYPPLAYAIFYIFSKVKMNLILLSIIAETVFSLLFFITLYKAAKVNLYFKIPLIFSLFFSGIFLSSWERGNIIMLAAACLAFYIFYRNSDNKFLRELSLIIFSVVSVLKITPCILALILLYDKRYKDFVKVILYSIFLFFIPFLCFKGGFESISILFRNIIVCNDVYLYRGVPDFSIISNYPALNALSKLVYIKISFVFSIIALFTNFAQKIEWKRIAQLLLVIYSISPCSGGYVMLYFFIFIVLFFNKANAERDDFFYLLLMVIILNPFQIVVHGSFITWDLIKSAELTFLIALTSESFMLAVTKIKNYLKSQKYLGMS